MAPLITMITGIGRACAISFAREGCDQIALADMNFEGSEETARLIKNIRPDIQEVYSDKVDVSRPEDVKKFMEQVATRYGRIDYAVNAAGVLGPSMPSHEMSIEDFDKIVNVDYRGLWLCSREELKYMTRQDPLPTHDGRQGNRGAIVNIASQLGIVARTTARE